MPLYDVSVGPRALYEISAEQHDPFEVHSAFVPYEVHVGVVSTIPTALPPVTDHLALYLNATYPWGFDAVVPPAAILIPDTGFDREGTA